MKQDKYRPGIYWNGGKMFFTGGAFKQFHGISGTEYGLNPLEQQVLNSSGLGILPPNQIGLNKPNANNLPAVNQSATQGQPQASMGIGADPMMMAASQIGAWGTAGGDYLQSSSGKSDELKQGLGAMGKNIMGGPVAMTLGALSARDAAHKAGIAEEEDQRRAYRAGTGGINHSIYAANGGMIPKLTEFNTGGTHEQNPNRGIQQGVGDDGKPNLVEEGETKFNNYVFSDRLTLPNAKEYLLGGSLQGKTFADISKKLSKSVEQRPNDPIAQLGQDRVLNRLKTANDDAIAMQEFSDQNPQMCMGGKMKGMHKFEYGGYIFKDI